MTETDKLKDLCTKAGVRYVEGRGDPNSPIWLLGEAPGEDEETQGFAFVGKAGREQDTMVLEAGFGQWDIFFDNPYKVRPPDNKMPRLSERGIPLDAYENQFFEQLQNHKPRIIIAAGATPLGLLCPETIEKRTGQAAIGKWRGSLLESPRLGWPHYVLPMYHPAFVLREWAERDISIFCLQRAKEEIDYWIANGKIQPLPERQLLAEPSYDDAMAFMHDCLVSPDPISTDIEMLRRKWPYTISFAISPWKAMSLCFWDYPNHQAVKLWRMIDAVLWSKKHIGQNFLGFDCHWLETLGFRPNVDGVHDTLVRHHVLWPELSHKLQYQVMQYTREPYFKDEGKSWSLKEGKKKLMRYNCKDTTTTYEVYLCQEEEFDDRPGLRKFYEETEMPLARKIYHVEQRGVLTHKQRMEDLKKFVMAEVGDACARISTTSGRVVVPKKYSGMDPNTINLSAPKQVGDLLKGLGLKLYHSRQSGRETTAEDSLRRMYSNSGNEIIKDILVVRENMRILGTYINAKLAANVLYCNYVVTGTVTGRRSSRKNVFGLGTNHQNLPKHSKVGKKYRSCIIARPGKIFVAGDQAQAEDWVVNAIIADASGHDRGLNELRTGVDRHKKLAAFILGLPEENCGKGTIERFLGKKSRHAGNYDMHGQTMSDSLVKEGIYLTKDYCDYLLTKFHEADPEIREVFHAYVQREISERRMLKNPLGRERMFFGCRPWGDNSKIFRDAYAYIPQSTVGDNTGLAILHCETTEPGLVVMDIHDQTILEVDDNEESVIAAVALLEEGYNRVLEFPKGTRIKIPTEYEIGYDLHGLIECADCSETGLTSTLNTLRQQVKAQSTTTIGAP